METEEQMMQRIQDEMIKTAEQSGAKVNPDDVETFVEEEVDPPGDDFVDDTDPQPKDDDVDDDESILTPDEHEAQARSDGWVPKEEFDADPKNRGKEWMPADEFNRRKPLIEKISGQSKELKKVRQQMEQMQKRLEEIEKGKASPPAASTEDLDALQERRRQAIRDGDEDLLDEIDAKLAAAKEGEPAKPAANTIPAETQAWLEKNQWFLRNEEMHNRAKEIEASVIEEFPDMPNAEILEQVEQKIRKEFAHKFSRTRREATGAGGGRRPASGGDNKGYSDLPEDARKECDQFVRKGVITREQFVKEYFSE